MKILFALNQNKDTEVEDHILSAYVSNKGKEYKYSKEYDIDGVYNRMQLEKIDILILNEDLERSNKVTTSFIDKLTDEFPLTRIILIISPEHKGDTYVKRLFNLGVYDLIYTNELKASDLIDLMINERTKADAKRYLSLNDVDDVVVESELTYIEDNELARVLDYFSNLDDSYVASTFEHVISQYNESQILYLIERLQVKTKDVLVKEQNEKYLHYLDLSMVKVTREESEPTVVGKDIDNDKVEEGEKPHISPFNININLGKGLNILNKNKEEKVIVKERILGTLSVGVGSVVSGSGTTHTTLSIASYLQSIGNKVAIVEFNDNPKLKNLGAYGNRNGSTNYLSFKGLDIYYQASIKQDSGEFYKMLSSAKAKDYKYIILDLGVLKRINDKSIMEPTLSYNEMFRADHQFLCLDGSYWNWNNINFYRSDDFANVEPSIGNWTSMINFTSDKRFREIEKEIRSITVLRNIVNVPIYLDPFNLEEEELIFLNEITKEFVSSNVNSKKTRGLFRLLKE